MLRSLRRTFTSLVRPDLAAALARQSITSPTSIQREALPLAMAGADVEPKRRKPRTAAEIHQGLVD